MSRQTEKMLKFRSVAKYVSYYRTPNPVAIGSIQKPPTGKVLFARASDGTVYNAPSRPTGLKHLARINS